jgi:isopentenyl diphosphate isomerase/L-lactate dehydrogenase-like FMN-dependent dehydrogenase
MKTKAFIFSLIISSVLSAQIKPAANTKTEGEVRKKAILDDYEKAKSSGIMGVQYIENLRHTTNLIDTAVKSANILTKIKTMR